MNYRKVHFSRLIKRWHHRIWVYEASKITLGINWWSFLLTIRVSVATILRCYSSGGIRCRCWIKWSDLLFDSKSAFGFFHRPTKWMDSNIEDARARHLWIAFISRGSWIETLQPQGWGSRERAISTCCRFEWSEGGKMFTLWRF